MHLPRRRGWGSVPKMVQSLDRSRIQSEYVPLCPQSRWQKKSLNPQQFAWQPGSGCRLAGGGRWMRPQPLYPTPHPSLLACNIAF